MGKYDFQILICVNQAQSAIVAVFCEWSLYGWVLVVPAVNKIPGYEYV